MTGDAENALRKHAFTWVLSVTVSLFLGRDFAAAYFTLLKEQIQMNKRINKSMKESPDKQLYSLLTSNNNNNK